MEIKYETIIMLRSIKTHVMHKKLFKEWMDGILMEGKFRSNRLINL